MGSTAKIIYSSVLAILVVFLFLIFYMQKSAQLVLDKQEIQDTVAQKELAITTIQQALQETTTQVDNATNSVIPELTSNLAAAEKETTALQQEQKALQEKLDQKIAEGDKQLTEFTQLQDQYKEQNSALSDTKDEITSLQEENTSLQAQTQKVVSNQNATQTLLEQKQEQLQQLNAAGHEKDQAIAFYSDKLETTEETLKLVQTEDATRTMNLSLVLDELALKTQLLAKLQDQSGQTTGVTVQPDTSQSTAVSEINALIVKMNQEATPIAPDSNELQSAVDKISELELSNTNLQSYINEQSARIQSLLSDLQNNDTNFIALQEDLSHQQIDNEILRKELDELSLMEEEAGNALTQLQILLTDRENEIEQVITESQETIIPLVEKIEALDLQLTEFQGNNVQLTETIALLETNLSESQTANETLSNELEPAKAALEESTGALSQHQDELDGLNAKNVELQTDNDQLSEQVLALQSTIDEQNSAKETVQSELEAQLAASASSLLTVQDGSDTLKNELEQLSVTAAEKDTVIQELTEKIAADNSDEQLQKNTLLVEEIAAAKVLSDSIGAEHASLLAEKESIIQDLTTELNASKEAEASETQIQEIALLTEAAAATKLALEEQAAMLSSTQQQFADLELKNKELVTTLGDNQSTLTKSQEELSTLTAERDQLLLMTSDSDKDGVSDADDTCPDTVPGAEVNVQGCEEDKDNDGLVNRLDLCPGTASGTEIDSAGCSAEQTTIILEGISFQFGTAELTEDAHSALNSIAAILQNNSEILMEVAGHTDSIGEENANLQLSTLRAQSVLEYLVSQGVTTDRLQAKGYGANEPVADNTTKEGRAQNRRVELKRIDTTTPVQKTEET